MHDKPSELPLSPKDPEITEELQSEFVSDKINAGQLLCCDIASISLFLLQISAACSFGIVSVLMIITDD